MSVEFYTLNPDDGTVTQSDDQRMQFPAGEEHVKEGADSAPAGHRRVVVIRGTNANDYMAAAMWASVQRGREHPVTAIVPYLPGARQDRGFPWGAEIYADLINLINADEVICLDPHSDVGPFCTNNVVEIPSTEIAVDAATNYAELQYTGIIAPDKGARRRAAHVAHALKLPFIQAGKRRDPATGALSEFVCPKLDPEGNYLVVDDICDGGGTFVGLAKAIDLHPEQLGLFVSHGIFSGSWEKFRALNAHYGEIFTTDSYHGEHLAPWPRPYLTVIPALPYLLKAVSQ
ncbi:hypothetical protein [Rhodococcoides fascians]|uniref:hypothetical protein n=1 Tax=Rhodococcoides fascians TaxID=1828 RepID=UPI0006920EE5|nr:hypothetical protein [Rhodococcus fascians]